MSAEENKAVIRRYIEEIWSDGKLDAVHEILNETFLFHGPIREVEGLEVFKQFVAGIHSTFPDINFTVDDLIAEKEKVVVRWTMTGTHTKEFMGIAPTGKHFTVPGTSVARFSGGKMAEIWLYWDRLGLLEQVGAVPTPG